MVNQAQPQALLRALSQQMGLSPQEIEGRAHDAKVGLAATMAALQDGCDCRACKLLRTTSNKLIDDAMTETFPHAASSPVEP
jgi:hypothetical protein